MTILSNIPPMVSIVIVKTAAECTDCQRYRCQDTDANILSVFLVFTILSVFLVFAIFSAFLVSLVKLSQYLSFMKLSQELCFVKLS